MSWKPLIVTCAAAWLALLPFSESVAAQGRGRATRITPRLGIARQPPTRQLSPARQEPAFARGYGEGYREGAADGKRRDRYDPADSRQYRNGEDGYADAYGSRDAYRTNYRAGFRQGYEDGYRDATR